jgi:hypothetical protein
MLVLEYPLIGGDQDRAQFGGGPGSGGGGVQRSDPTSVERRADERRDAWGLDTSRGSPFRVTGVASWVTLFKSFWGIATPVTQERDATIRGYAGV